MSSAMCLDGIKLMLLTRPRLRLMRGVFFCAVALAFRAQMVEEVPIAENDRGVDIIVTADGPTAVSASGAAALES